MRNSKSRQTHELLKVSTRGKGKKHWGRRYREMLTCYEPEVELLKERLS